MFGKRSTPAPTFIGRGTTSTAPDLSLGEVARAFKAKREQGLLSLDAYLALSGEIGQHNMPGHDELVDLAAAI